MKRPRIKYCMLLMLFLLLNFLAMKMYAPIERAETKSDIYSVISQKAAAEDAIRLLHYIYSNPKGDAISVDNQSHDLKFIAKLLIDNSHNGKVSSDSFMDKSLCPYLHLNTIQYYIYALEKIVV